jgi:hypothetical protein
MKKIKLNECKTFLMPEDWYFDNFNTHPLCGHCIVGKQHDRISGKGSYMKVTVLNNDELFTIKLTCGGMLIPSKRKRFTWYYIPRGYSSYTPIVEYACGSFRQLHSTQYRNKSLGRCQTIHSFKIGDWSSVHDLYKCKFTLEDYMKQFPNDVRGEHFADHGKLERIKEIVYDDVGADEYQPDRANTISMFYHSTRYWDILQSKLEAEADWEYDV